MQKNILHWEFPLSAFLKTTTPTASKSWPMRHCVCITRETLNGMHRGFWALSGHENPHPMAATKPRNWWRGSDHLTRLL